MRYQEIIPFLAVVSSEACTPIRWSSLSPHPASRVSASETVPTHHSSRGGSLAEAACCVHALEMVLHINFKPNQTGRLNREQYPSQVPFYLTSHLPQMNYLQRNGERQVWEEKWRKKVAESVLSLEKVTTAPRKKYL